MTTSIVQDEILDEGDSPEDPPVEVEEFTGINWPWFAALIGLLAALLFLGGPKILFVALAIGGFLIFHEAGHYLTARWSGMKVTEFFIGFGQTIFAFKRGETTFGVKIGIPFGAYVRIIGMNNLEDVAPVDEHRTYRQAAWYKRVLTIVAGPATHFVTAFVLLTFLLWQYGPSVVDEEAWAIENINPSGVLAEAGLENGDRLISIAPVGEPRTSTETWDRFLEAVEVADGQAVSVVYQTQERAGSVLRGTQLTLPTASTDDPEAALGFQRGEPDRDVFQWAVGSITPFSAAEDAGLLPGDQLVSIDGVETPFFSDVAALIPGIRGQEVELEVVRVNDDRNLENLTLEARIWERLTVEGARNLEGLYVGDAIVAFEGTPVENYEEFVSLAEGRIGETVELQVVYDAELHTEQVEIGALVDQDVAVSGFLGVSSGSLQAPPLSVAEAARRSPGQIVELVGGIAEGSAGFVTTSDGFLSLFALGSGDVDATQDQVSEIAASDLRPRETQDQNRPISIVGIVRLANQLETEAIIGLLAIMNLFFGLFNLLPLLPLDGGHIALATYERVRSIGRREGSYHADAAKLLPLTYVVVAFFLVVGVISIVRDIVDPLQL